MSYHADVTSLDEIGRGPFGHRVIGNVTGGEFGGPGLAGTVVGSGADWLLLGDDGHGRIDVRVTFRTDDGAHIFVQYHGILEITSEVREILAGQDGETPFGGLYFFTHPRLETGDDRYSWVNRTFFVGQGRLLTGPRVEYQIFKVDNPA